MFVYEAWAPLSPSRASRRQKWWRRRRGGADHTSGERKYFTHSSPEITLPMLRNVCLFVGMRDHVILLFKGLLLPEDTAAGPYVPYQPPAEAIVQGRQARHRRQARRWGPGGVRGRVVPHRMSCRTAPHRMSCRAAPRRASPHRTAPHRMSRRILARASCCASLRLSERTSSRRPGSSDSCSGLRGKKG